MGNIEDNSSRKDDNESRENDAKITRFNLFLSEEAYKSMQVICSICGFASIAEGLQIVLQYYVQKGQQDEKPDLQAFLREHADPLGRGSWQEGYEFNDDGVYEDDWSALLEDMGLVDSDDNADQQDELVEVQVTVDSNEEPQLAQFMKDLEARYELSATAVDAIELLERVVAGQRRGLAPCLVDSKTGEVTQISV